MKGKLGFNPEGFKAGYSNINVLHHTENSKYELFNHIKWCGEIFDTTFNHRKTQQSS